MTRTALVTGAAGGIGRAVATRFAANGYQVLGIDVADPGLPGVAYRRADVTDAADVANAVATVTSRGDSVDVLVTCAGVTAGNPLHLTTEQEWDAVLTSNLRSVFLCTREVLPGMIAARAGTVITVGSVLHHTAAPALPAYAAAKGAIAALTRQLAVDYGQYGISFVTLSPGWVRTPATESRLDGEADLERLRQSNPLRTLGSPEHIAGAAVFAASPDGALLNGSELTLDAGAHVVSPASLLRDTHRTRMGLPPL
ncbi:SDR family oxidoreductase [Streptomyces sp. NBC_00513]|uniref:SDR family NAD(P)-dependent oxidoreductase n=1 Tax=unclassified Streptomyces TaxID=2593676 RepID=UPI0022525062|nr:SDR family oxidoreductase [Streptomyces sp. NBC_00424]MCX5078705.1 SDR family oxidoreductase [Streptomyces sp. NBC_00424]WUD39147.1 SDR family oxidoreductase [Streptomyces sp. NBC_00513]